MNPGVESTGRVADRLVDQTKQIFLPGERGRLAGGIAGSREMESWGSNPAAEFPQQVTGSLGGKRTQVELNSRMLDSKSGQKNYHKVCVDPARN